MLTHYSRYIEPGYLMQVDDYYHKWGRQTVLNSYLINCLNYLSLPGFLHYEDRNTMAFSLEGRAPFLDHRLVELMLALPNEFKIGKGGVSKMIMREALKDILPSEIVGRTDKQGFYAPIGKWLKTLPDDFSNDEGFRRSFSYLNFAAARQAGADLRWRLLTLHKWYTKFICRRGS